jgi:hypothetical protein
MTRGSESDLAEHPIHGHNRDNRCTRNRNRSCFRVAMGLSLQLSADLNLLARMKVMPVQLKLVMAVVVLAKE